MLHIKMDFADVIKVLISDFKTGDYPGSSGWALYNYLSLIFYLHFVYCIFFFSLIILAISMSHYRSIYLFKKSTFVNSHILFSITFICPQLYFTAYSFQIY